MADKLELGAANVLPPDPIVGWTGCSAQAWFEWDTQGLLFHAEVKDSVHNQDNDPENLWRGDSIQIAFNAKNDASIYSTSYSASDYEYGFALGNDGKTLSYCWAAPPNQDKDALAKSLDLDIKRNGILTNYKIRIPWRSLTPFESKSGQIIGFSFIVNDNNGEKTRNYCLALTPGISESKNPGLFRKLVLLP